MFIEKQNRQGGTVIMYSYICNDNVLSVENLKSNGRGDPKYPEHAHTHQRSTQGKQLMHTAIIVHTIRLRAAPTFINAN